MDATAHRAIAMQSAATGAGATPGTAVLRIDAAIQQTGDMGMCRIGMS